MDAIERRGFITLAGVCSAVLALPGTRTAESGPFTFHAMAPLPQPPHHAWAAQVVDGAVGAKGSGLVTSRVMAAGVELPGSAHQMRITVAGTRGLIVLLDAVTDDESPWGRTSVVVDRSQGLVHAPFLGRSIEHQMS